METEGQGERFVLLKREELVKGRKKTVPRTGEGKKRRLQESPPNSKKKNTGGKEEKKGGI